MAVNYIAALQTSRMTAVINAIDVGTAGTLEIATAAYASILATIALQKPSFSVGGTPPNCKITMLGVTLSATAGNTGTAAVARIKDSSANVVINNLSVGTSATDIVLNSTSITSGQTVSITAGSITHSA